MELKPCPRCQSGHTGVVEVRFIGEARIECHNCKLAGPYKKSPQEAIEWWNTRVTDPLIEEIAEKIADHYYKDELLKELALALEELDDMFDPTSRVGEIINKALQKYHEQVGE